VEHHPRADLIGVRHSTFDRIEDVLDDSPLGQQRKAVIATPLANLYRWKTQTVGDEQVGIAQHVMADSMPHNSVLSGGVLTAECRYAHLSLSESGFARAKGMMLTSVFAMAP
jgi:hypothetical protein